MWTCPRCDRRFQKNNQSHFCVDTTIDDLFEGKPEDLLLTFDRVLADVYEFGEMTIGTSKNTIIFTTRKAFLIIRPMTKTLDIKFYSDQKLHSSRLHKMGKYGNKYYYHLRLNEPELIDEEILELIRVGYVYSNERISK